MPVIEAPTEEEAYLYAILTDRSGIDQAEFLMVDNSQDDGCFRAWPFQWHWWADPAPQQIDQNARSVGKSLGIKVRGFRFPFVWPGHEMLVTAPELIHLEPVTSGIEDALFNCRLTRELIVKGRSAITHRPFACQFANGSRILGRIPQRTGRGIKGAHPLQLEQDEACFPADTFILTQRGLIRICDVKIGDEVWTHRNRWRPVTAVHNHGVRDLIKVVGQGHPGLSVTSNHHFWAQRARYWKRGGLGWEWIPATELPGQYWASPLTATTTVEVPPIPDSPTNVKRPVDPLDPTFLFLMGVWIAEGSVSSGGRASNYAINRATWSVTPTEATDLQKCFDSLDLHTQVCDVDNTTECVNLVLHHSMVARWLVEQCGKGAHNKRIPPWVLGLPENLRRRVFDGIIYGDGFFCKDTRYAPGRWKLTTVSKELSVGTRLLGQALGFHISAYWLPPKDRKIRGKVIHGGPSYQVVGTTSGQGCDDDGFRLTKVRRLESCLAETVYDLTVEEDASFVADGVVVHNSDYPDDGWTELAPTVKMGVDGAQWRAHGVTRGIRDKFWEFTQPAPDNPWKVHNITAMSRPDWTDDERQRQIKLYGSKDDPDYRRNILGLHGDATNPIFVLRTLMRQVDQDPESAYNSEIYTRIILKDEQLDYIGDIEDALVFPSSHKRYPTFWIGMDIGFTQDPSEILVFAEYPPDKDELKEDKAKFRSVPLNDATRLRLLSRISLHRISHPLQVRAILKVVDFYEPSGFGLDKTGIGLGLFDDIQHQVEADARETGNPKARRAMDTIKGYNFSEKVLASIDQTVPVSEFATMDDTVREAGITRNVLELSTDRLREIVDDGRLMLPWDRELIGEFQGQTYTYSKGAQDAYGRRRLFSSGNYHALDAARMAAMTMTQAPLEQLVATAGPGPVFDSFL